MEKELEFVADIVRSKTRVQAGDALLRAFRTSFSLSFAQLLVFSADGQTLIPHDDHSDVAWSVMDFDVPFAHVLQSGKGKLLSVDELNYWQSNRAFKTVISEVGLLDGVYLLPLVRDGKVQALLFLIGRYHELKECGHESSWFLVLDSFLSHWDNVSEITHRDQDVQFLQEKLSEFQHQSKREKQLTQMSQTLIGESEAMKTLRAQILSASDSMMSVLLQGETGTGKELAARAVHDFSSRAEAPFVAINCAAIPDNLLESELFGYVKGAFSGADQNKEGLIAEANGGTLFLDEIGDMPLGLQAKLLRVLESGYYRPVGGKSEQCSNFRLVSATHVQLYEQVQKKSFRQDLYYRLLQFPVMLPALSSRQGDIEQLCRYFVKQYNEQYKRNVLGMEPQALVRLSMHHFPGNVRELKHLVEFGCVQTQDGRYVLESSFHHIMDATKEEPTRSFPKVMSKPHDAENMITPKILHLKKAMEQFEIAFITERLRHFQGDRNKTANSLGIPKRTLAYKCQKWEIY
ncbi:AAA domain-containing protein [Vibrio parahaemolyticus]|uniref:sigma-54 interaction domain-containing protein n=1 Tax=Vibrio owensii TaxID=696485 RepID=UPI001A2DDDFF|nr:sigma 54-interacting transcriptional regulator [Vibrio owensii]EGQ7810710.1 AAA domain-containing protein [Vibrio parahaemolyticus]MDA0385204.1 sigma 54-interacting transcriptional regulator [Vibrio owensii]